MDYYDNAKLEAQTHIFVKNMRVHGVRRIVLIKYAY